MWIAAARDAHLKLGIKPTGAKIGGFDVADAGADYNAHIWRHGVIVQFVDEWKDIDPNSATDKVFNEALLENVETVHFDNIGVGAGAKGKARELIDIERSKEGGHKTKVPAFEGFNAAGAVRNPESDYRPGRKNVDQFLNAKSQAWWLLADRFKNTYDAINGKPYDAEKIICIPNELPHVDKLCAELSQPQRQFLNGKFRVEPKDQMAKRHIASPNLADALVMCYLEASSYDIRGLL
jgi:phage terminase large subunit